MAEWVIPATFQGPAKPFCPCDAGRPQDCKPEEWPGAHAPAVCTSCKRPRYQHRGRDGNMCPIANSPPR